MGLKRQIEQEHVSIDSGPEANRLSAEYFGHSKAASSSHEVSINVGRMRLMADIVLKFGPYKVLVETKFYNRRNTQELVKRAIEQTKVLMAAGGMTQAVVIIFQKTAILPGYDNVQKFHNGKIYSIVIRA